MDLAVMTENTVQGLQAQVPPLAFALYPIQELDALDIVHEK
jgi:hypothetical protein